MQHYRTLRAWIAPVIFAPAILAIVLAVPVAGQTPTSRSAETAIELAWQMDPITFPYSLRAFQKGEVVEIQGKVPTPFVRKQALNIARLHHAKLVDLVEVSPASARAYVALPKDKVTQRFRERLAVQLPQLVGAVQILSDDDGRVTIEGAASSLAEKMALADIARGVPGCMSLTNRVEIGAQPAPVQPQPPVRPASHSTPTIKPVVNEHTEIMREKLTKLFPTATGIGVLNTGPLRYQIQFIAANDNEASRIATAIFNHPEWKHLRLDIGAHVPR